MENRPKLETYFKLDNDPAPLVIVDFHVYLHSVKLWFEERVEGLFKPEVEDKLIKGAWALKVNRGPDIDRKSTRLNSSHVSESRMPSSA